MKWFVLVVLSILFAGCSHTSNNAPSLQDARAFAKKLEASRLAHESDVYWLNGKAIKIKVYQDRLVFAWPGNNTQTIEIEDEKGNKLNSKVVGGSPRMTEAWSTQFGGKILVYIKCAHRHSLMNGVYIYEIDKDFSVESSGVYFSRKEIRKQKELDRETDKVVNKEINDMKKDNP